jgi:hypothetical protein
MAMPGAARVQGAPTMMGKRDAALLALLVGLIVVGLVTFGVVLASTP